MKRRIRLLHGRLGEAYPVDPLAGWLSDSVKENATAPNASNQPPHRQSAVASQRSRVSGFLDREWMAQRKVLVFGSGVVGSRISLSLAPYGIGQTLIDYDIVEMPNVLDGRTPYTENDLGLLKVVALRQKILAVNPAVTVTVHPRNVHDFTESELVRLAEGADSGVVAIDEGSGLLRVNRIFYPRLLTFYPAGHQQARSGQIIVTRPGSPCLACCMGTHSGTEIRTLHGEPGLGIHFGAISQLVAQIVIQELAARWGSPLGPPLSTEVSILFVSNMSSTLTPHAPGVIPFHVERDGSCDVCGNQVERR